MMRKTIVALLLVVALLGSTSTVSATQSQPSPPQPGMSAILSSPDTGRQLTLQARQQSPTLVEAQSLEEGESLAVYTVEATGVQLASVSAYKQKWDSSRAVLVTIYMYYSEFESGGVSWVSIDRYTSKWRVYVSGVSMSSARISAGCASPESWDGPPEECDPPVYTQTNSFTPSSGVTYVLSPYWRGHYQAIYDAAYQAGSSRVTLRR